MTQFHNPYHFVPVEAGGSTDDLGRKAFEERQAGRASHQRYLPGTYSGRIVCRLATQDAVIIGAEREKGGENEPARVVNFEIDRRPAIPASTLRGLIGSIAEAASNSALRVLTDALYSYRRRPQDDPGAIPSAIGIVLADQYERGKPAWKLRPLVLPTIKIEGPNALTAVCRLSQSYRGMYPIPNLRVFVGDRSRIVRESFPYRTYRMDQEQFFYLKLVDRQWDPGESFAWDAQQHRKPGGRAAFLLAQRAIGNPDPITQDEWLRLPVAERRLYRRGIMRVLGCWDRDVAEPKKHELFIPYPEGAESWPTIPMAQAVVERFEDLADQRTEAEEKGSPLPYHPAGTERESPVDRKYPRRFRLKGGDLVYFLPTADGQSVAEISLSSIWRGRVEQRDRTGIPEGAETTYSFFRKIDEELVPFGERREKITIAEQLFGFVERGKEEGSEAGLALASRVRFSQGLLKEFRGQDYENWTPDSEGLASPWGGEKTLKILDSPKPPSPALYFRPRGGQGYIEKRKLSAQGHIPHGRKFYLHRQSQPAEPWWSEYQWNNLAYRDNPELKWTQRSLGRPIRSGAVFYFHVDFSNLSRTELGLLAYALRPSPDFRHKIGMGKPIGLGCVKIEPVGVFYVNRWGGRYTGEGLFAPRYGNCWVDLDAQTDKWPARYGRELQTQLAGHALDALREEFEGGMRPAIRNAVRLLGRTGHLSGGVHYPTLNEQGAHAEDELYRWFVENDAREAQNPPGRQFLTPISAESQAIEPLEMLDAVETVED